MGRKWTSSDDEILKEFYIRGNVKKLAKMLNRTEVSIRQRAQLLGLKNWEKKLWTKREDNFIREMWGSIPPAFVASSLNRTIHSVNIHASHLKLRPFWTKEEDELLKENWSKRLSRDLAPLFGRTSRQIAEHAALLGIKSGPKMHLLLKDPNFVKEIITRLRISPNKPELKLISLFKKNNLSYDFVGDGSFILGGQNPDFVNVNGQKKIIEFFGEYWHDPRERKTSWKRQEFGRKAIFSQFGFDTLIIWENELKDMSTVLEKIKEFDAK